MPLWQGKVGSVFVASVARVWRVFVIPGYHGTPVAWYQRIRLPEPWFNQLWGSLIAGRVLALSRGRSLHWRRVRGCGFLTGRQVVRQASRPSLRNAERRSQRLAIERLSTESTALEVSFLGVFLNTTKDRARRSAHGEPTPGSW